MYPPPPHPPHNNNSSFKCSRLLEDAVLIADRFEYRLVRALEAILHCTCITVIK